MAVGNVAGVSEASAVSGSMVEVCRLAIFSAYMRAHVHMCVHSLLQLLILLTMVMKTVSEMLNSNSEADPPPPKPIALKV